MPEQTTPDEIIMEMKCAHCFKEMTREMIFCSQPCREKGYLYPQAHGDYTYISDREKRRRFYALASYYRNRKLKVQGRGRPRKDGSNLISI